MVTYIVADSSLSQTEKEEREVERLIDKKPAPSRKNKTKRGPKFDNRRRRMKVDDPDLKSDSESDNDMSLNYKNSATSNERFDLAMSSRFAQYHGVDDRSGNPQDPINTGYKSYDKRYFNEDHWKSIVSSAKELLDSDWFKYGWDGGSKDAPLRAALDTAIYASSDSLFQSKIDVETYNMLLNRLANWGHDTFSETLIPEKSGTRRSAAMNSFNQLVMIAERLKSKSPRVAFAILKNARHLASTRRRAEEEFTFESLAEPSRFEAWKGDIQDEMKKLFSKNEVEDFMEGFEDIISKIEKVSSQNFTRGGVPLRILRQASSKSTRANIVIAQILSTVRSRIAETIEFQSLADPEAFKKFKEELKKDSDKLFKSKEVEDFMDGFDDIISKIEKQSSYNLRGIPVNYLVKVVARNASVKNILGPIIVAAKKDEDEDEDQDEDDKKEKSSRRQMGSKRRASITAQDAKW